MSYSKKLGKQNLNFEEPDLLVLTINGDVTSEEIVSVYAALDTFREQEGKSSLLLIDARKMASISSEARTATIAEIKKHDQPRESSYTAVYGASFQIRLLINLVLNAVSLVTRRPNRSKFFKTEEEARTWLQECRAKLS